MNEDDIREWEYLRYVSAINREKPYDDEYGPLAVHDALTAVYCFDSYPRPPTPKKHKQTAASARGGEPLCRE